MQLRHNKHTAELDWKFKRLFVENNTFPLRNYETDYSQI